jgi:hypothetical protein
MFCGASGLVPAVAPEGVEPPEGFLPFQVSEADARVAFRTFAASSFWYPSELRRARLNLRRLLLPAWSWSGRVETHWVALVPASTNSGRRPAAGVDELTTSGVLIPSSKALTHAELAAISPYEPGTLSDTGAADLPFEVGSLTRTAATREAIEGMERIHARKLDAALNATVLRTSVVVHELRGGPLLLPVWIGAYRVGEKVYRVVINGQTGRLTGTAPISWLKVAGVVVAVVLVVFVILVCLGVGGWVAER